MLCSRASDTARGRARSCSALVALWWSAVGVALGAQAMGCEYVAGIGDRGAGLSGGPGEDGGGLEDAPAAGDTSASEDVSAGDDTASPDVDALTDEALDSTPEGDDGSEGGSIDDGGDSADGPDDGASGDGSVACQLAGTGPASHSDAGEVTSMVRLQSGVEQAWGVALSSYGLIRFSLFDDALQLPLSADPVLAKAGTSEWLGPGRLVWSGSKLFLAYSRQNDATSAVELVEVDPSTGHPSAVVSSPGFAAKGSAPFVGNVAIDDTGTRILVPSVDNQAQIGTARVDMFATQAVSWYGSASQLDSFGLTAAWVPGRQLFGVPSVIVGGSDVWVYDRDLVAGTAFPFSVPLVDPPWGTVQSAPYAAGVGDRLYVAWISVDAGTTRVVLRGFDPATGTSGQPEATTVVSSAEPGIEILYPKVVFDGQLLAVAWLTTPSYPIAAQVHMQRVDLDMNLVGAEENMTNLASNWTVALGDYSFVAQSPGVYLTTYYSMTMNQQWVTRVECGQP